MKAIYSLVVCSGLIISSHSTNADDMAKSFGTIRQTTRQLRDVPRVDFAAVSDDETWAVARFMPTTPGVTVIVQPSRLDPVRKLIVPDGPPEGPLTRGKVGFLALLTPQPKPTIASYKWTVPSQMQLLLGPPNPERDDKIGYSVFIDGGVALCQINAEQSGEARFAPAFPIPAAWQSTVLPAYQFYQAHRDLFAPQAPNAATEAKLRALLNDPNPFLAVMACRRLNEAGKLDAGFVTGPLAKVSGLRQAIFVYLLMRGSLKPANVTPLSYTVHFRRPDLAPQAAVLVKSQNVAGLHNLAVGLYAAGVNYSYDIFEKPKRIPLKGFGPALLRAIAARTRELKIDKPHNQNERELFAILKLAELR